MKKRLLCFLGFALLLCLTVGLSASAYADGGIAIDGEHFPDASFRQYVKETWDSNSDDVLSADEIGAARNINLSENDTWKNGIASLDGIQYFTNLRTLRADAMPNISGDIDFSQNRELRSIRMSNIVFINGKGQDVGARLNSVTLGNLPMLGEAVFTNHHFHEIDVSGCPALENLDVSGTNLTELDVSALKILKVLQCSYTYISELDVSNNTQLFALNVFSIKVPFTLTLGNLPDMRALAAQYTHMDELDISGCPILIGLLKDEYYTDMGDFHRYETAPGNDGSRIQYSKPTLLKTRVNQVFSTLVLPAALRQIETEAFAGIAADIVVLPESCESVAALAFANCPNLQIVYAPAGTAFDAQTFSGCGHVYISRTDLSRQ